jgi:cbb3-type cytochrome c oxidase subunit III
VRGLLAFVAAIGLGVFVLFAGGCGTGGLATGGDTTNGQKLFTAKCGGCHTLAAAGTSGTIGPNLDGAFYADRKQGIAQDSIQNVVLDQIRLASGAMPRDIVKGQDAEDVAAFVASVAGTNTAEPPPPTPTGNNGEAIFKSDCSSCHTLTAANATGTVGPNLDQLKPAEAVVKHQVINGGGVMPAFKGKLTDAQIDAVAKYVADNAGKK